MPKTCKNSIVLDNIQESETLRKITHQTYKSRSYNNAITLRLHFRYFWVTVTLFPYQGTRFNCMSSVFTKIINGELPGRFIYRDDTVAAFLDIEPLAYGHTLIVPVQEVDKWTDLAPNVWCEVNEVAQSIGRAVMEAFDAERAGYVIAGFDVPHAHIHVFPTNTMADYDFSKVIKADETDPALMDEAAEKLRAIMDTNEAGYAY